MTKPDKSRGTDNGHGAGSELTAAAAALDSELRRFDELAAALKRIPLTTQKNLEKAARATAEVQEAQKRVGAALAGLTQAIAVVRDRHIGTAQAVGDQAERIAARTLVLSGLVQRYAELGEHAKNIGSIVAQASALKGKAVTGEDLKTLLPSLELAQQKMSDVAEAAGALARDAQAVDAEDIARQADSLKQQILSARNKLALLAKGLAPS